MSKLPLIICGLIICLFICTGCYSSFQIKKDDLPDKSGKEIMIKLKDGKNYKIENGQADKLSINGEYLFITGAEKDSIKINDIETVNEKRINYAATFFTCLGAAFGILIIILVITGGPFTKMT